MNSRIKNLVKTYGVLCLMSLLVACQDTIPARSTITSGSSTGPTTCPEGQILKTETVDGEEVTSCVAAPLTRPDNAVFWKNDFCACKDRKPVSYGNCSSFCASKATNGAEILYANFTVTEAISLSGLGNMYAWCKVNLPGDAENPECELQARDDQGNVSTMEVTIPVGSNSLTANIQDKLDYDKTYVLTLVEKSSGAKSDSIQMIKFSTDVNTPIIGPLRNAPISQYTCLVRDFSTDSQGNIYFLTAYRLHFYFIPRIAPDALPPGTSNLICHDIFNPLYGTIDNQEYPRMETLPGIFNLWDKQDPRFFDNNGNGSLDVNELIIQKTRNFGGSISAGVNFFAEFKWPGSPVLSEDAGNNNGNQSLGQYMAPWIDQSTFKSYCLNSTHYNGANPLFKAMRDIIGVDTEGLYIGEKAAETVTGSNGQPAAGYKDYILIRETDLKQVWFYLNNGVPTAPTDANVANNTIFFYYPLNRTYPFTRSSTQRLFRVKGASELNNTAAPPPTGGATSTGATSSYPPHDRKIGCVPKF